MRKDVKFGFAIGGVLLAVLIVYVLVVPGTDKNGNEVADIGGSQQPTVTRHDPAPTTPSTPTVDASRQATPTPSPIQTATPDKPADPVVTSTDQKVAAGQVAATTDRARNDVDWAKLLDGQPMPALMSQTGSEKTTSTETKSDAVTSDRIAATPTPNMFSNGDAPSTRPSTPSGPRSHTVQPHETLSSISSAAYGTPNHWKEIAAANPKLDPHKLKTGMVLTLPEIAQTKMQDKSPSHHASASDSSTVDSVKEYRVQAGDTLHRISVKLYGKIDRADKIYELNKETIGTDPNKLKLNMLLKLPESPTIASR